MQTLTPAPFSTDSFSPTIPDSSNPRNKTTFKPRLVVFSYPYMPRGRIKGSKNKATLKKEKALQPKVLEGGRPLEFYVAMGKKGGRPAKIDPLLKKFEHYNEDTELPHLDGYKFYKWSRKFFESQNKMNLVTAANQIGKSLTNIRKCIHWATEKELWPTLWPKGRPYSFFYLYPDRPMFEVEWNSKWIPQLLPRGKMKDHKQYGWAEVMDRGKVVGIKFNTGVIVWFKTYSQKVSALQGATLHAVFTDEELPVKYFPELQARLTDTDGYFSSCFTATLGQEMWRQAMQPGRGDKELFPTAFKMTVSLYDCMTFEDGSPGRFNEKRIDEIKQRCSSQVEIDRRVYGKFVHEEGIRYTNFDVDRHVIPPFPITDKYLVYAGVDIGSGGINHPSSIIFVAVETNMSKGYVFKGWRGDNVGDTASSDVMDMFLQLKGRHKPVSQVYDHSAKEFGILASRIGEPFLRAEKSQELGSQTINTLFKNNMLYIFDDDPELQKLVTELLNLRHDHSKSKAKDDLCDGLRFCCMQVPWDWSTIVSEDTIKMGQDLPTPTEVPPTKDEILAEEIRLRRAAFDEPKGGDWGEVDEDIAFWNERSGS